MYEKSPERLYKIRCISLLNKDLLNCNILYQQKRKEQQRVCITDLLRSQRRYCIDLILCVGKIKLTCMEYCLSSFMHV